MGIDNWNIIIKGEKVCLIPYHSGLVLRYHEWMLSEKLREETASEPLTLNEEHDMQKSWRSDPYKYIFIIIAGHMLTLETEVEEKYMAGDVNLIIDKLCKSQAEVNVMIAEEKYRRLGFAKEAVLLMMSYGLTRLGITRFFARINESNNASIALFTSLGYIQVGYVSAFQEFEFEYDVSTSDTLRGELTNRLRNSAVVDYSNHD